MMHGNFLSLFPLFIVARFPLSQMPTLQVDDKVICQSSAIFRYVASEYGFYGENTCEQVNIDQICETLNDIGSGVVAILYGGHDEEAKVCMVCFASKCVAFILIFMEKR